jgi:hypothetical protein
MSAGSRMRLSAQHQTTIINAGFLSTPGMSGARDVIWSPARNGGRRTSKRPSVFITLDSSRKISVQRDYLAKTSQREDRSILLNSLKPGPLNAVSMKSVFFPDKGSASPGWVSACFRTWTSLVTRTFLTLNVVHQRKFLKARSSQELVQFVACAVIVGLVPCTGEPQPRSNSRLDPQSDER